MAHASTKQSSIISSVVAFDGGLNVADDPAGLPDNQLAEALNLYYAEGRSVLTTRPGLVHVAAPPPGGPDILALHWYAQDVDSGFLVAATADGKLFSLDLSVQPPAWNHVTDLDQPGVTPSLVTFHGKLVIADGGPHLRTWDGASVATIASSPSATALVEVNGRLAANSAQDLDGVAFSGPFDETDWDIGVGAVFLRAGYGDGLRVNAFGVIGKDLVVFKSGDSARRILRLQTGGTVDQWSITELSRNQSASGPRAVEFVGNNLFFAGHGGIMDLAGVQQYGDIQVGVAGRPVNPLLGGRNVSSMRFVPALGAMLVFIEGDPQVLAFHPHNQAWTRFDFQGRIMSGACQAGGTVYLAGRGGSVYRLGLEESRDELQPGDHANIASTVRSRVFTTQGALVLRSAKLDFEALSPGSGSLQALGSDQISPVELIAWNANPGLGKVNDSTGPLADAVQILGASSQTKSVSRTRFRDWAVSFQLTTTGGRIRLRRCLAEFARVNG
ncbi:hypothetical protein [Fundidesulfovibrio soli]|uniref:hypothetical protein n=1 Tax=Fundidesulfovibrio soli TaxID=2922716 RepID=UPI001FAF9C4A|nr:hypothetical protein [Fundidesulfovibrio soli]